MAEHGIQLSPQSERLLKHVVAEGMVNEESVRVAYGAKRWEGVSILRALNVLTFHGMLERTVHGNYVPTEAGRLRATQKNPPRNRNRRRRHA